MKNPLHSFLPALVLCPLGMANTVVTLDFATDTTGIIPGNDASLVEHDPTDGGRVKYSATAGWKPNCVRLDFTATPALEEVHAQLVQYGGTITFTTSIDTTGLVVDAPPDPVPPGWGNPNWFENMVNSNPGENAIGTAWTLMSLYGGTFPLAAPRAQTTTIRVEPNATADTTDTILQISPSGSSAISIGINSESTKYNSATLYLDNVIIDALGEAPVVVIPTLGLKPAKPGLNVIASTSGQYDRQGLRTTVPEFSWVGAASYPVTYSIDIAEYPPLPGHQTLMYLVPAAGLTTNLNYPDWAQPVCARLEISNTATGEGDVQFGYKDDPVNGGGGGSNGVAGHEPWVADDGSGQGGRIAGAHSTTMIGKWSVTFTSATEVTLETPQGTTASGQFLQSTADKFAGEMFVYFAALPNQAANVGQSVIIKEVAVTGGVANPFTEGFDTLPFDPARLEKSAVNPASILQVTRADSPYWMTWTLPASGFGLQQSPSLKTGEWVDLPTTDSFSVGGTIRYKLLYSTEVSAGSDYFRMLKP